MTIRDFACLFISFFLALIVSCGGTSKSPTPGAPPPPGQPPSNPPGQSSTPSTYHVNMVQTGTGTVVGQLTINPSADNGNGTLQLNSVTPNSTFNLRFCPFPTGTAGCTLIVTTLTTDASGSGQSNFTFPSHGTFTGVFLAGRDSMQEFDGAFNIPGTGPQFQASLQPAASITGGLEPGLAVGNDPLKSGQVSIGAGTMVHVVLQGAAPNATYGLTFCMNGGGSGCYATGTFTTDASGNATADLDFAQGFGQSPDIPGVFLLGRDVPAPSGSIEFATAFRVP